MPERDFKEVRPPESSTLWPMVVVLLVLAAGALWWYRSHGQAKPMPPSAASASSEAQSRVPVPAQASGPINPVSAAPGATLPSLTGSDAVVKDALEQLLGRRSVLGLMITDGFVRRFVATVDNLARDHAPGNTWPVQPMPARFAVQGSGPVQTIAPGNARRYTPLVSLIEKVDPPAAAAFYFRFYPLFQQAYEELGYPGRYFNDRLVAVVDQLLAAPEPQEPVQIRLIQVHSDVPMSQPWDHYEFVDPQLQALSAGQKIMVRVGLANERRLKAWLRALRAPLVAGR